MASLVDMILGLMNTAGADTQGANPGLLAGGGVLGQSLRQQRAQIDPDLQPRAAAQSTDEPPIATLPQPKIREAYATLYDPKDWTPEETADFTAKHDIPKPMSDWDTLMSLFKR